MKRLTIVLLPLLLVFAACDPSGVRGERIEESPELYHDAIVLGEKVDDPYTVANMQAAYDELYKTKAGRTVLKPTDLYVRFLPENEYEYKTLVSLGLEMTDHPLDYRIVKEGDYYHDPGVPQGNITWQYAVVPSDFRFPNGIKYEILDECYIPSETPTKASDGIDWRAVERASFIRTGNSDMLEPQTKASSSRPSGRITVKDPDYNGGKPVGVSGIKVSVNTFVKFSSAYTDVDGYYTINTAYDSDIRYRLVFKNAKGFGIGFNLILVPASVSTLGKHGPEGIDCNIDQNSDRKLFSRCVVNNAVYDYFERCSYDEAGITPPPANLRIWIFQNMGSSSAPMLQQGAALDNSIFADYLGEYKDLIKRFLPDITLGVRDCPGYESIYSVAVHELAHASHFMKVGKDFWDRYITYIIKSFVSSGGIAYGTGMDMDSGYCAIGEMWAYFLQNVLYKLRYGLYLSNLGTAFWFKPQILLYLEERGLSYSKIFKAMDKESVSVNDLENRLIFLYPEYRSVIEQSFNRYE